MSSLTVHYEEGHRNWREMELDIVPVEGALDYFDVVRNGVTVGRFQRRKNHRTHQVHGRIRYDNKPRTRFQRDTSYPEPRALVRDTRIEVIGEIVEEAYGGSKRAAGTSFADDFSGWHQSGRGPKWIGCGLCE